MRPLLLRFCLTAMTAFVVVPSVLAQQQGQPFKVTSMVTLSFVGPGRTFYISGTGTGTIGDYDIEGYVTLFTNEGGQLFAYGTTTMVTADGDLYLEQFAHSSTTDAEGSYCITGGTGIYEGASGAGAFKVLANPDGTQTGMFNGSLIVPVAVS